MKTTFFSWDKIVNHCKGDPYKSYTALKKHFVEFNPRFDGTSFLLNPKPLITCKFTVAEQIDYVTLASLRNYFDVQFYKQTGLLKYFSPMDERAIRNNRLLSLNGNYINFTYED